MRKKLLTGMVAVTGILLFAGASPAFATDPTAGGAVVGGGLTVAAYGATIDSQTLDGATNQVSSGTSQTWTITDARGTGAAWTLVASATDFTSAVGGSDTTVRTLPASVLSIVPGTVTAGANADAVGSTLTAPSSLSMSNTAQTLVKSTGTNRGQYTLAPVYKLTVPANSYRSNASAPYTSTLTFTIS